MFKACSGCPSRWETLEGFLSDPDILLAGYQVHPNDLEGGLFFFTHAKEPCFTTLAIPVTKFLSLNDRPLVGERNHQLCSRSEFCQHQNDLSPKPKKCECIWVRELLQIIQSWPKETA
jgi:hypothetical protein